MNRQFKKNTELLNNFHGYKFLEYINSYIYNQFSEIDQHIKQYLSNEKSKKTDIIDYSQLYIIKNKNDIIEMLI